MPTTTASSPVSNTKTAFADMNTTTLVLIGAATSLMLGWDTHAQVAPQMVAAPIVVLPGAVPVQPLPAARWTTQQIRQAFDMADSDSDGVLSRAEAQHLSALPRSFEEMDQNKDGSLTRAEYEAAFAR